MYEECVFRPRIWPVTVRVVRTPCQKELAKTFPVHLEIFTAFDVVCFVVAIPGGGRCCHERSICWVRVNDLKSGTVEGVTR